jgi:glycerophosphoryl diester phosphodiesterase
MHGKGKVVVVLVLILFACQKKKDYVSIRIAGHAGMGLENTNSIFHDNSFESIEMALAIDGCDGVEVDVQRAADGSLWLYHDDKLETQTNSSGCISTKTTSVLTSVTYSTVKKEKLLEFKKLPWERLKGKRLFLDVRHYSGCDFSILDAQEMIHSINNQLPVDHKVDLAVILNRKQWVQEFVSAGFNVFLHVHLEIDDPTNISEDFPGISGVILKNNDCQIDDIKFWKSKGKKVVIFEMRSPKGIRKALNKYPDEVITDDVRATLIEKY